MQTLKKSKAREEFKTVVIPALKAYGKAINDAVLKSVVSKGKRKGRWLTYNCSPGYLDLHTGEFVQDSIKLKRIKLW